MTARADTPDHLTDCDTAPLHWTDLGDGVVVCWTTPVRACCPPGVMTFMGREGAYSWCDDEDPAAIRRHATTLAKAADLLPAITADADAHHDLCPSFGCTEEKR